MSAITRHGEPTSEARIAKALAHPLRARILRRLGERVASPGELAIELDAPLGVVSYHVRMLRDYECVELVRTEPRRGALQHFYRAVAGATLDDRAGLPGPLRGDLASETLSALVMDIGEASVAGNLTRPDVVMSRLTLEVDERAASRIGTVLDRAARQITEIAEQSAARGDAHQVRTEVGLIHFRRA